MKLSKSGGKSESEGVLMIVTIFGIIVFHLVEQIAFIKKPSKEALIYGAYIKAFPYPAIRARHEIPRGPYLQEDNA